MEIAKNNSEGLSLEDIRDFVRFWNSTYPIDYWWRKKHKVAFGCKEHKEQSILDMRIEFEEDRLIRFESNQNTRASKYLPGRGDWLNKRQDTREIGEDVFDSLNIDSLRAEDFERKKRGESGNDITITKD